MDNELKSLITDLRKSIDIQTVIIKKQSARRSRSKIPQDTAMSQDIKDILDPFKSLSVGVLGSLRANLFGAIDTLINFKRNLSEVDKVLKLRRKSEESLALLLAKDSKSYTRSERITEIKQLNKKKETLEAEVEAVKKHNEDVKTDPTLEFRSPTSKKLIKDTERYEKRKLVDLKKTNEEALRHQKILKTENFLRKSALRPMKELLAAMIKIGGIITTLIISLVAFRNKLIQWSRELGGVSLGTALENRVSSFFESVKSLFSGTYVTGSEIQAIQKATSDEFGGLISPKRAKELAQIQIQSGLTAEELIGLQRALQGTIITTNKALSEAKKLGIPSRVFTMELSKSATAVARAGNNFKEFIVEGIKNAKRLGLEFEKIEKTLTGFSTDFSGTVTAFSELRSIMPEFSIDFTKLMETSLTGSTNEYIEQIRNTLKDAGISKIDQLNRAQIAMLERATGFSGDQIQRILAGSNDLEKDMVDLDKKRNFYLKAILIGLTTGFGALVGTIIAAVPWSSIGSAIGLGAGALSGALMGASTGAILGGAGVGLGIGSARVAMMNDFVSRPGQPPIPFSSEDTLIGVKDVSDLSKSTTSINTRSLEQKMDMLIKLTRENTNNMKRGLDLQIKDFDKALLRRKESETRNA